MDRKPNEQNPDKQTPGEQDPEVEQPQAKPGDDDNEMERERRPNEQPKNNPDATEEE